MAWIESHQTLREHPKTKMLVRRLGVPRVAVIGHLHCLWWWALDYAPDGVLGRYDDEVIADAAEWEGDAAVFVGALRDVGFLDPEPDRIHDWDHFGGKLMERRRANADRMRDQRATHVQRTLDDCASHVQDTCGAREEESREQDTTGENRTGEENDAPGGAITPVRLRRRVVREVYSPVFEAAWAEYPLKAGKHGAWTQWQARVREGEPPDRLAAAARHYAEECRLVVREPQFTLHGRTFFGEKQRRYLDYADGVPESTRPAPGIGKVMNALARREARRMGESA